MQSVMKLKNGELGRFGEFLARRYLQKKGWELLDCNWRNKLGEVDIIALDNNKSALVFVEVKTRRSVSVGYPSESVNYKKLRTIKGLVGLWIDEKRIENREIPYARDIRIDVVSILVLGDDDITVSHIENANI
ncbi:MAG: YraN family protein [Bifidobacteriaceae bacterium]|nr:YraN family protein [Bifidobacteriaceae bacterium]